jgi:endoglycosylceramidase
VHQDILSSKFCLYDGAPLWVINKSKPLFNFPFPLKPGCDRAWGSNSFAYATQVAYQDIYDNYAGMRDDLVDFWVESAKRWKDHPAILGYELINEPFAGNTYLDPLLFLPGEAGRKNLMPLYNVLNEAIRKEDDNTLIFYEPVTWGMIFNNEVLGSGFTVAPGGEEYSDRAVFAFHYYCWWRDVTSLPPTFQRKSCEQWFYPQVANAVAKDQAAMKSAAFLTEFGDNEWNTDKYYEEAILTMAENDKHFYSWTNWAVCADGCARSEDVFHPVDSLTFKAFSRTYAPSIAGSPLNMTYTDSTNEFELCYIVGSHWDTKIFFQRQVNYASVAPHVTTTSNLEYRFATDSPNVLYVTLNAGSAVGSTECVWLNKAPNTASIILTDM